MIKKNVFVFVCALCLFFAYSCTSLKYKDSVSKMYYFVVQIHSVKSDTITYEVIEIYCRNPTFKISNVEREDAKVEVVKLPLSNFNKGYLNGVKKKQVGSVMVLYTLDTWIGNDNFVKFDNIKKKDNTIFLSDMHRLGK